MAIYGEADTSRNAAKGANKEPPSVRETLYKGKSTQSMSKVSSMDDQSNDTPSVVTLRQHLGTKVRSAPNKLIVSARRRRDHGPLLLRTRCAPLSPRFSSEQPCTQASQWFLSKVSSILFVL